MSLIVYLSSVTSQLAKGKDVTAEFQLLPTNDGEGGGFLDGKDSPLDDWGYIAELTRVQTRDPDAAGYRNLELTNE